jgi:hypothetical protein
VIPRTPVLGKLPSLLLRNLKPPPTPVIGGVAVRSVVSMLDQGFSDKELDAVVELASAAPEADPAWAAAYPEVLKASCAYFASEVLRGPKKEPYNGKFLLGRHHLEWDDLISEFKRINILAARDHGKSFMFTWAYPIWKAGFNAPGSEGYIFSATEEQAVSFLTMIKDEIEQNQKMQHLLPINRTKPGVWSRTQITLRNGSIIKARGFGTKVRGGHPNWVVCDDVLNDDDIYSDLIRQRNIDYFLSAISGMVHPTDQLIVIGCVTPDSYVTTAKGLQRIGAFDQGAGPQSFSTIRVDLETKDGLGFADKFWDNGETETIRVGLKRGFELEGSHRHPLWCLDESGVPQWRKLSDLKFGDYVALRVGAECWGDPIDLEPFRNREKSPKFRNALEYGAFLDEDLAYLLGLWTAEGSSEQKGRVSISNTEPQIQQWLLSHPCGMQFEYSSVTSPHSARCSNKEFCDLIEYLGGRREKAPGKVVPERIMTADRQTVIAFLQGFFDGDGCAHRAESGLQVSMASTSRVLAEQVQQLLLNFGILSSRRQAKLAVSERVRNPKYPPFIVRATGEDAELYLRQIGFRLRRKQLQRVRGGSPSIFQRLWISRCPSCGRSREP